MNVLRPNPLPGLLIAASFFIITTAAVHFGGVFEYDYHEEYYLMRAYLHASGHALYKEIWLDQPPAYVLMLSCLFKVCGPSAHAARLLTLMFSTLLVWAFYRTIEKALNPACGLWAVVLMVFSPLFLKFSVSAVNVIPGISLAVLSLYTALLYGENRRARYLFISGALFGLSFMTRFFSAVFLPAIFLLVAEGEARARRPAATAYACWAGACLVVLACLGFWACSMDFSQMLQPYLLARDLSPVSNEGVVKWLGQEYDILVLIAAALLWPGKIRRPHYGAALLTFLTAALVFATHRPVWEFHRLYLVIPMYWLASYGVGAFLDVRRQDKDRRNMRLLSIALLGAACAWSVVRLPPKYRETASELHNTLKGDPEVTARMESYRPYTHLVVTDRPIYAFYAGLPADPFLASITLKRVLTGLIGARDYIEVIRKERPELVLFARPEFYRTIKDFVVPQIAMDYALVYKGPGDRAFLYALRSGPAAGGAKSENPADEKKQEE